MTKVFIVIGAYYDGVDKDILGVYSTVEAATARVLACRHRGNKGLDQVDYAYVYEASLDVDIKIASSLPETNG